MTCLAASCFRLGLEMEAPGPARKSPLAVLLARANLGNAGSPVETPWEILASFSCMKSSTQLEKPQKRHLASLLAYLGQTLPFLLQRASVSGSTARWRGSLGGWGQTPVGLLRLRRGRPRLACTFPCSVSQSMLAFQPRPRSPESRQASLIPRGCPPGERSRRLAEVRPA